MTRKSVSIASPQGANLALIVIAVGGIAFAIYYLTAFRTITWWNSPEYTLAAATLGVTFPPGCLLSTILGWGVVKLAICGSAAFAVNLFAGLIAAVTAIFVGLTSGSLLRKSDYPSRAGEDHWDLLVFSVGAIIGALTLAFAQTFWLYSVKFTPYIFTVFLTALLVLSMIKWAGGRGSKSAGWIFVIMLLFGLDFSVHRTNLLMLPGLIVWILLIHPRTLLSPKSWASGIAGLALGLAFHLLMMPMAAAKPFLNAGSPDTLNRFWDYIALQQLGGGFLVQFFPRKAPFWSVQVMDYLRAFSANFFSLKGPVPGLGLLPGLLGIIGLIGLYNQKQRLAIGMMVLFLLTSLGAILYFNIPANFFRSLFRHYMPSFVIFSIWVVYGIGSLLLAVMEVQQKRRWLLSPIAVVLLLILPGHQLAKNYGRIDGSHNFFASDYAMNIFNTLPENAILITFGDNDTFPLWYFQIVEGIRPDVTVLNTSLLNTSWFVRQSLEREPELPLGITPVEAGALSAQAWQDTTIFIPVEGIAADFNLAEGTILPDSMELMVSPTVKDQFIMISDQLLMNIIRENRWVRPIYFSAAGGISWLNDYLQREGVANRLTPVKNPPVNVNLLATNLFERYAYRGYADENIYIDPASRTTAVNYLSSFFMYADAVYNAGDQEKLDFVKAKIDELIPPDRIRPLPEWTENYLSRLEDLKLEPPATETPEAEVQGTDTTEAKAQETDTSGAEAQAADTSNAEVPETETSEEE